MIEYTGIERRKRPENIEQLFREHEEREREMTEELRREFFGAFPNGDLKGHCAYHNAKIKAAMAEEQFWLSAKSEALKHGISGLFAVLKWLAILALLGLAYKVGLGPAAAKILGVGP